MALKGQALKSRLPPQGIPTEIAQTVDLKSDRSNWTIYGWDTEFPIPTDLGYDAYGDSLEKVEVVMNV